MPMSSLFSFDIPDSVYKGIVGQLAGHGLSYGKLVASGKNITLTSTDMMWIAYSLGSEAVVMFDMVQQIPFNETIVPAGLQVGVPYMYQDGYKTMITRIMEGDISRALDNPTYLGTIGSVLAKILL